jgi:hypothetical protein
VICVGFGLMVSELYRTGQRPAGLGNCLVSADKSTRPFALETDFEAEKELGFPVGSYGPRRKVPLANGPANHWRLPPATHACSHSWTILRGKSHLHLPRNQRVKIV